MWQSLRGIDRLLRELVAEFHYLAVSSVCCERSLAQELAFQYWRDLTYPAVWEQASCEVEEEANRNWKMIVRKFIDSRWNSSENALLPPCRESSSVAAYCPRCHQQYTNLQECSDCGIGTTQFQNER